MVPDDTGETTALLAEIDRLRAACAREKQLADTCRAQGNALHRTFEQEKMDFILNFSHELRSPLMKVLAYIETLQDPDTLRSEKAERYLDAMHHHVLAMSSLIEELFNECYLDVEQTYHMVSVDTSRVFIHYCEELELYVQNSGRQFACNISPGMPPVRLDAGRFAQVMSNLVENAVKFTPKQGGRITVWAEMKNGMLRVRICDNGRGISAERQAHIFDRFYTSGTSSPARRSSGLGLAIVRTIIQAHNGTIQVKSRSGRGTQFEIYLPLDGGR
ncbi:MAG: HAMP domain-containing sensor histidine kinase [Ethanoligenens sp.]|uniref:sensor histidine kinase n=1 Tax=Ethanoligenens sp. TaxID=2099655 RepID=UPI0039EB2358